MVRLDCGICATILSIFCIVANVFQGDKPVLKEVEVSVPQARQFKGPQQPPPEGQRPGKPDISQAQNIQLLYSEIFFFFKFELL